MKNTLKKSLALLLLIGASALPLSSIPASAAAAPATGAACLTIGASSVVSSPTENKILTYSCVKSGKKKVWGVAKVSYQITTALNLSQVWTGNSVALSLVDSSGHQCIQSSGSEPVGSQCSGFYIGWQSNWNDSSRTITYGVVTKIAGLQPGDQGNFYIAYQATQSSPHFIVKLFPFSYNTWS